MINDLFSIFVSLVIHFLDEFCDVHIYDSCQYELRRMCRPTGYSMDLYTNGIWITTPQQMAGCMRKIPADELHTIMESFDLTKRMN